MRGATLIEAMVAVAIIGIASGTTFLQVTQYRGYVTDVRRGYHGLDCAEREVEWLKTQPRAALLALAGKGYTPRWCEAPAPALRLSRAGGDDVFVLELEVKPALGPARTVPLPFTPASEGTR
jgi:hypothetical protein